MKDLADTGSVVATCSKQLRPGEMIADAVSRALVSEDAGCVGIVAAKERRSRWTAVGSLTVRVGETNTLRCQTINIRCSTGSVAITGKRSRRQVIGDYEEDIESLRLLCESDLHRQRQKNGEERL